MFLKLWIIFLIVAEIQLPGNGASIIDRYKFVSKTFYYLSQSPKFRLKLISTLLI